MLTAFVSHQLVGLGLFGLALAVGWWGLALFVIEWVGGAFLLSVQLRRREATFPRWLVMIPAGTRSMMALVVLLAALWGPWFLAVAIASAGLGMMIAIRALRSRTPQ